MSSYEIQPRRFARGKVSIPCSVEHLHEMARALLVFANSEPSLVDRKVRITIGGAHVTFTVGVEE